MPIPYTVLPLLEAARGCLAEIELEQPALPAGRESQWLWIEDHAVAVLKAVGGEPPSVRVFDRAVLTVDGTRGELRWPGGRCDALVQAPTPTLRPEFRRLEHQHLN